MHGAHSAYSVQCTPIACKTHGAHSGQAVKSPTRHLDSLPALARWKVNDDHDDDDDDGHDNGQNENDVSHYQPVTGSAVI